MAKKKNRDKQKQHDAEVQAPPTVARQEAERPASEDEAQGVRAGDEAPAWRARSYAGVGQGVGCQDLICWLPKRQRPGGYVEPDLPLRHIPAPF